jgi:long-chain fatty acid transport protein
VLALGVLAALGAALTLGARQAHASPEDIFGFGARSSAMGATGPASAEGYEAVYGNPALLSTAQSRQLTVGLTSAAFDVNAQKRLSYEPLEGSVIGAVLPLPFGGILKDRIALGLGFFTPFDVVVRGRILDPTKQQYPLADRAQSLALQAGVGVDVGHGLRIGAGFAALAALSGSVLVATDASGRVGTTVDDTLVASYGPIVGVTYDIDDAWRVGVTFRGVLEGDFDVQINVKDLLGTLTIPTLNISGVAQYDPWQIALEVMHRQGPWKLATGLTYKRWSIYPGLAEPTVRCPATDPTTMTAPDCTGLLVPAPPSYHDTVSPHVGVERAVALASARSVAMHVRGGLFYEPSPAPVQSGTSNLYDDDRLAITAGYGVEAGPSASRIALDLFGQTQVLIPRENIKTGGVPAQNAGSPRVTVSGLIGAFGATAGVKF